MDADATGPAEDEDGVRVVDTGSFADVEWSGEAVGGVTALVLNAILPADVAPAPAAVDDGAAADAPDKTEPGDQSDPAVNPIARGIDPIVAKNHPGDTQAAGSMFWFTWKRFSGSYFALTACNRS